MDTAKKAAPNFFDGAKITRVQKRMFLLIMLGYFFDQLDNFTMAFVAPALIQCWGLSMTDIGKINSLYFVGMLTGGLTGGWLSDKMGRKRSFLLSILTFSLFSFFNGLAPNLAVFMVSRFLTGVGIAAMTVISLTYVAEISPGEARGKWLALIGGIGVIAVPLMGFSARVIIPLNPQAWRIIFFVGSLGIFAAFLGFSWLKESPRWLVSKGRIKEAEKVVEEIIPGLRVDFGSHSLPQESPGNMLSEIGDMFKGFLLKRTLVTLALSCIVFAGSFVFLSWAPTLLRDKGFSLGDSLLLGSLFSLGTPLGALLAAPLSDKGGRKIPMVLGLLSSAVFGIVYGMMTSKYAIMGVGLLFWLGIFFVTTLIFAYIPENYPTRIRNTASGFIWSTGRIATALVQLLVPSLYAAVGYTVLFVITGVAFSVIGAVVWIWGIKTAGRSLEEINQETASMPVPREKVSMTLASTET
jgi:MFS transporter, putative metabolite:H+ symporter